jgi:hypothetical protein
MIKLTQNSYISLVVVGAGDGSDFLGILHRPEQESTTWWFDYRFRYHVDAKVFDSQDQKSWYHMVIESTSPESEILRELAPLLDRLRMLLRSLDILEIHGGVEKCSEALRLHPAFAIKPAPAPSKRQ